MSLQKALSYIPPTALHCTHNKTCDSKDFQDRIPPKENNELRTSTVVTQPKKKKKLGDTGSTGFCSAFNDFFHALATAKKTRPSCYATITHTTFTAGLVCENINNNNPTPTSYLRRVNPLYQIPQFALEATPHAFPLQHLLPTLHHRRHPSSLASAEQTNRPTSENQ